MPFNGAGVYSAPGADFPAVTQTVISSTHYNNVINDIATGLSLCLTKDGQQVATANIPFGGFRATNVGITGIAGSVGTPAINVSDTGTGLYRSAASELAVTVAGVQVARFASTGLIVTGAASVSTTLTATTSVVTPMVASSGAVNFTVGANGGTDWVVVNADKGWYPNTDNTQQMGGIVNRISKVFTPIIDSGTTGSLSLKTNNGTTQAQIFHTVSAVNFFAITGNTAGVIGPVLGVVGADTNANLNFITAGTGKYRFLTAGSNSAFNTVGNAQFEILDTASATRNITITGSNGGNPTISTTAGSLAITPSVVIAGNLQIGANPGGGVFGFPANANFTFRNIANSGDVVVLINNQVNSVSDVIKIGSSGCAGVLAQARSGGAAPTTSDLPASMFTVWRDTGGATTKLYYNNGGVIQSVALA